MVVFYPFLMFSPHLLVGEVLNLDTFADFPYYAEDPDCLRWNKRMAKYIYQMRRVNLIKKYHLRYANQCVPVEYRDQILRYFKHLIAEMEAYPVRPLAAEEMTRAELADELFFNSLVEMPEKAESPRRVRLVAEYDDFIYIPPLQLPGSSPKGILKKKIQ